MAIKKYLKNIVSLSLLVSSASAFSGVIYTTGEQSGNQTTGYYSSGSWRVYDDFTVDENSTLSGVENWQVGTSASSASDIGDFSFEIFTGDWTNADSLVSIYSETFNVGDYAATTNALTGITNPESGTFFDVDFNLTDSVSLMTGTDYVFSMFGVSGTNNQIRWANTGSGNGFNQFNGTNNIREGNTPITLVSVPGPETLGLLGLCLVGLGFARKKKAA